MVSKKLPAAVLAKAAAGFALLALGAVSCSREAAKTAAPPPLAVRVARVESRPMEITLDVTGSLVSSVAVDVKTEFAGRIVSMLKQAGDRVAQGELLAQIDDANARLSLGQARASLEVAQAAQERAQVGAEHARTEFERSQNLLKTGGITDRDLQAAQMAQRDAQAQVKVAEAQVEQARQSAALAEKRLRDCRIISPISGEVDRKALNPGGWVDGNVLLYRLVDNQRLELDTFVASSDLASVKTGQALRFTVAAYPGENFEAKLISISAAVDMLNRSAPVRAAVPNPNGKLKAGMFIKGRIITGVVAQAMVIAPEALWRRAGQAPYVYVVEGNQARKREVKLGREEPAGLEITDGLRGGETVVLEQNLELAEGVTLAPRT